MTLSKFRHIRLPIIPEEKKAIIIENLKNHELKSILKEIIKQDLKKGQDIENGENHDDQFKCLININLRWKPRIKCSDLFYLIGGRNEKREIVPDIIRINSFDFKFTRLKQLSVSRFNHQTSELNGLLYIAGGMNSSLVNLNLVETFDPYENEKISTSFMIYSRQDFGLVNFNNNLLAIGGSIKCPNLIEKYDPKTNKWTIYDSIDELPVKGFRTVKVDNKIFIIGGTNKFNQMLDQTLCYNPETKQIKRMNSMKEARSSFGCTFSFGCIYVIGGSTNKTAERYSLIDNKWTYIAELDRPIENCCVTVAFNKILTIGGEDPFNKQLRNTIDCYDPEHNKWSSFTKILPFKICSSSLVKI